MASSSLAGQVWEKTSTPRLLRFKKDGKYRLCLKYTPAKGKKAVRKTSQELQTEVGAQASSLSWRLSWEQGRGGTHPNHDASQETFKVHVSGSSSAVPLQGEFKVLQDLHWVELRIFIVASRSHPKQGWASHDPRSFALHQSTPRTV